MASLPCYSEDNVDKQRGRGVFERSIEGLKLLNAAGYGVEGSGLQLDLVYNPGALRQAAGRPNGMCRRWCAVGDEGVLGDVEGAGGWMEGRRAGAAPR